MSHRTSPLDLPYARLNLRRNPFGSIPLEDRGHLAVLDLDPITAALEPDRAALQIVGDRGHGKTTHLLAIRARLFPDAPYIHLDQERAIPAIPAASLLFLDEAQRFPRRQLAQLGRGTARLVLGTHADHARALSRAGRPVTTIRLGPRDLTADRLGRLLGRRIEHARRGPGPVPSITPGSLSNLLGRHGSNIRAIEDELYDHFCDLGGIADVDV